MTDLVRYRLPADVVMIIIDIADIYMLRVWRQTCHAYYRHVCVHLRLRYVRLVQPFFVDVDVFDAVLRKYCAVISGSVAMRYFLTNEFWASGDMDIYVPDTAFDSVLDCFLSDERLGCRVTLRDGVLEGRRDRLSGLVDASMRYAVKDVVRLITRTGRAVDLVRSRTPSAVTPLLEFWSTLVRNFVSLDVCACMYPRTTFRRQAVLKPPPIFPGDHRAIAKYASRGFSMSYESFWVIAYSHPAHFCESGAVVLCTNPLERGYSCSRLLRRYSGGWAHVEYTAVDG